MSKEYRSLDDILEDPDDLGLLKVKDRPRAPKPHELAIRGFDEIQSFVETHNRAPRETGGHQEQQLARRLSAIRTDPARLSILKPHDQFGLLPDETEDPAAEDEVDESEEGTQVLSVDDILAMEDELLGDDAEDIFEARHVAFEDREIPEEIAQRTPCGDYWRFEPLFQRVRAQLKAGEAERVRFQKESQVDEGDFFILDGIMCLVDEKGEDTRAGGRLNPRLRVIFDNGTESNLLQRSLSRALYKDRLGSRILLPRDEALDQAAGVTHRDKRRGWIYILRSQSRAPELVGRGDVLKIGYTERDVESRIQNAENESTYLEAPVEIAATFECFNLNPRSFETLIHAVLADRSLNITLNSRNGGRFRPREWFEVPLDTAKEVVRRIIDGSIVNYRLSEVSGKLVRKTS